MAPPLVELESLEQARATLAAAEARLAAAGADAAAVKLQTALCEQARRSLRKVEDWRSGAVSITVYVWQLGELFVVACPGCVLCSVPLQCAGAGAVCLYACFACHAAWLPGCLPKRHGHCVDWTVLAGNRTPGYRPRFGAGE